MECLRALLRNGYRIPCGANGPLACIDQVALREFDYVDIGSPMLDQYVVPAVVKSVVFPWPSTGPQHTDPAALPLDIAGP